MGEIPKKKHPTMIVPCDGCGKLIPVKPEHRAYKTHSCSKECALEVRSKQQKERWRKIRESKDPKTE